MGNSKAKILGIVAVIMGLLLFVVGVAKTYAQEGGVIVYSLGTSDGGISNPLYKKSAYDNGNGIRWSSQPGYDPVFTKDGSYVYYIGPSAAIWKKSILDTTNANGTQVSGNSLTTRLCTASPDGRYIVFSKSNGKIALWNIATNSYNEIEGTGDDFYCGAYSKDGQYLYYIKRKDGIRGIWKKYSGDLSEGVLLMPYGSTYLRYVNVSPDGNYLYYVTSSTSPESIWKKNINDSSTGNNTGYYSYYGPKFSSDTNTMFYSNLSGDYYLHKVVGGVNTAVNTWVTQNFAIDVYFYASCNDGIKNQDEVGVDYGGVCGGTYTHSGYTCTDSQKSIAGVGTTYTDFLDATVFGSGGTIQPYYMNFGTSSGNLIGFEATSYDQESYDYFMINNNKSTGITSASLTSLRGISTIARTKIAADVNGNTYKTSISISSQRNGVVRDISSVQFNTADSGALRYAFVDWKQSGGSKKSTFFTYSGGIATAYAPEGIQAKEIEIFGFSSFSFSGMLLGTSNYGTTTVRECANNHFTCKVKIEQNAQYCSPVLGSDGISGTCAFIGGYCQPTSVRYPNSTLSGGIWTNSGTYSSDDKGIGNTFTFVFNKMQGVGDGSCTTMFSNGVFTYGNANTSIMNVDLVSNFTLADTPWTCNASLINVDICAGTYSIIENFVQGIITSFNMFANFIIGPVKNAAGYLFEPVTGQKYCALGDKYEWTGKATSYYSYSEHGNVSISGMTKFDYIVILVLVCATFYVIFK